MAAKKKTTVKRTNGNASGSSTKMFTTKNDIPKDTRIKLIGILNERLADAIDLQTQMKQAHWNVKGPDFISLHELFDKINEDVEEYVDTIAERVTQLGGVAEGTARMAAEHSTLKEYPQIVAGLSHVDAVSTALADFGKEIRESIDEADDLEDKDTADIFTEISRGTDKWLWFVEAHMQSTR